MGKSATQVTLGILDELIGPQSAQVGVRLWDGTRWPDGGPRPATLVLKHPGALRAMFLPGNEAALGEAYLYDDFDIEGRAESVLDLHDELPDRTRSLSARIRLASKLLRLPRRGRGSGREERGWTNRGPAELAGEQHCIERDRQAIRYHYDVSNGFYRLWLDRHMVYSCAYFASEDEELDRAQECKLDYICRKLRLKSGWRLLDIGCGWGGLVLYAAQRYGVQATGITLSQPQADWATKRIAQAGLSDQCRVLVQDYREVDGSEPYDALVSVGMFEHVGEALMPEYFERAWHLLRPGGGFLNHGIASSVLMPEPKGPTFSNTYVFPDGELVPISTTTQAAERAGFEVRDVESLREHYVLTLRHWVRRLEAAHEQALACVDEPTFRVWRLFMSGSAHGFASGRLNLYQTLLVKPGPSGQSGLPLQRADWYREGQELGPGRNIT